MQGSVLQLMPINADDATFFTPSYNISVKLEGPKTLSAVRKIEIRYILILIKTKYKFFQQKEQINDWIMHQMVTKISTVTKISSAAKSKLYINKYQ